MSHKIHPTPREAARVRKQRVRANAKARADAERAANPPPKIPHILGEVDGEQCCLVCYAAPWMGVWDESCDTSCVSSLELRQIRTGTPRRKTTEVVPHMTPDQVLEAKRWREDDRTWVWISQRMGRPVKSLQRAVRMLERGEGRVADALRGDHD